MKLQSLRTLFPTDPLTDRGVQARCASGPRSCSVVASPSDGSGTITKMALSGRKVMQITDKSEAVRKIVNQYAERLDPSDLFCVTRMIEQGEVEVLFDRDSRTYLLSPSEAAEAFLDTVFDVAPDARV